MPKTIAQGKEWSTVDLNWKEVFYTNRDMVAASNVRSQVPEDETPPILVDRPRRPCGWRGLPRPGGVDPGRRSGKGERSCEDARQSRREPLVPAVSIRQLSAHERPLEQQSEFKARHAGGPDEGLVPHHMAVIPIYNSAPYQTSTGVDARTTNFGGWTQLEPVLPKIIKGTLFE